MLFRLNNSPSTPTPPIKILPFGIHPHKYITRDAIWTYLSQVGYTSSYLHSSGIFDYLYHSSGFLFNPKRQFGKAILKLPHYTRLQTLMAIIPYPVKYKITRRRIRRHLLRPTPTHIHFLHRFHPHPLPTRPPTPSLHNLIRHRLKKPITLPSSSPDPHTHRKTHFTSLYTTISQPPVPWKPQDVLYSSRYRNCFPREGVG
jgi:hypothetical protein